MFVVICYSRTRKLIQLCFPEYALDLLLPRWHCLILTCFATWRRWVSSNPDIVVPLCSTILFLFKHHSLAFCYSHQEESRWHFQCSVWKYAYLDHTLLYGVFYLLSKLYHTLSATAQAPSFSLSPHALFSIYYE